MLALWLLAATALAQTPAKPPQATPPIKVNYLNVCDPPENEQRDIAAALARIPERPVFARDFEIARGRSAAPDAPVSNWVHLRREFGADSPFITAQYSFSVDAGGIVETLVFRLRDTSDLLQIALEDKVTSGTPAATLAADTPATRIRIERMGNAPRGLSRCPNVDQSAYEPLFSRASQLLADYRGAMKVRTLVGPELARLGVPDALPHRAASPRAPARK